MNALFDEYRPRSWDQLVGHRRVKTAISRMKDRGSLGGRAFFISGVSGCGKTTCAYLIAADICDPENFIELDAGEVTPAKIDDLERNLAYRCIGEKSGRAVLLNEAHGLRKDTVRKLLVVLERIPNHVCWILTTTLDGQAKLFDGIDAHPLLSRCIPFELRPDVDGFAEYAKHVAEETGLGGAALPEYVDLIKLCKGNLREALCRVERGDMIREELAIA